MELTRIVVTGRNHRARRRAHVPEIWLPGIWVDLDAQQVLRPNLLVAGALHRARGPGRRSRIPSVGSSPAADVE